MKVFSLITACLLLPAIAVAGNMNTDTRTVVALPRPAPDMALIGEEGYVRLREEDTLADVAYRYALGYRELTLANPAVDPWLPGEGTLVNLPGRFLLPDAPRQGIVLNTAEMRLYYYPEDDAETVMTFPVSVGRGEWRTPIGPTNLVRKLRDPSWYPPESIRSEYEAEGRELPGRVPPGPDNPLGEYALYLAKPGYLIHGTNRPYGIGLPVTHGCIRLHPDDIRLLFERVPVDTGVNIVHQPIKAGWHDGVLYLEVHPPHGTAEKKEPPDLSAMVQAIIRATGHVSEYWVNWEHARAVARNPDGLPHPVGRSKAPGAEISWRQAP